MYWGSQVVQTSRYQNFLWACWFLGKKLAFWDPPSLKFHNRTDISVYVPHYVQNLDILSIKWTKIQATLYFYQTLRDYRVQIYSGQPQKFYEISKVIWHLFSKPQINVTLSSYFFFFLDNWNIIPFPNKNNFWVENVHL